MPGKRGKIVREPVSDISELRLKPMARKITIPIEIFKREFENGIYDGAYIMRGEIPFFVVHLVKDIQRKRALQSIRRRLAA